MVAEGSKATCNLSTDCSHRRTQVQIPLGDVYKVKILSKKELQTRYKCNGWDVKCMIGTTSLPKSVLRYTGMTLPKWVSLKIVKW